MKYISHYVFEHSTWRSRANSSPDPYCTLGAGSKTGPKIFYISPHLPSFLFQPDLLHFENDLKHNSQNSNRLHFFTHTLSFSKPVLWHFHEIRRKSIIHDDVVRAFPHFVSRRNVFTVDGSDHTWTSSTHPNPTPSSSHIHNFRERLAGQGFLSRITFSHFPKYWNINPTYLPWYHTMYDNAILPSQVSLELVWVVDARIAKRQTAEKLVHSDI